MKSFLGEVASALYEKYGDEISSLNIVFPSRRARLFFGDELAKIASKPLWQPIWLSMDDLVEQICGLRSGDRTRLITELYKIYSKHRDEPFDSFYFWGEILLSDFDAVDKYLLDADVVFANVADLKQLEADLSYLEPEQREIIARFWRLFEKETFSDQQQKFLDIWTILAPVYHEFRAVLSEKGMAYSGMAFRAAVEKIRSGSLKLPRGRYVVAGFNALSKCEQVVFDYLAKHHDVDFFWDWDRYYVDNQEQEAGLFLRNNLKRYPMTTPLNDDFKNFERPKSITIVNAPSDSLQCKYVTDFLRAHPNAGKETAIVLTDENLLVPVLHSIPPEFSAVNVTMGYPLKLTLEYSFVERLITLQMRRRVRAGHIVFHHDDEVGLREHPFAKGCEGDILAEILSPAGDNWQTLAEYLTNILLRLDGGAVNRDFVDIIVEDIDKLKNSLMLCGIELTTSTFASLLRRVLQSERVPFEGEPLEGVQVMGILETRNLDFENVLLLSTNDDTFPGARATSPSFIPHNLRIAYGLPTPQHHEGVFAYYFYRLLQRAENVHISYSSKADERSNGEQSRYIYQLKYESPHLGNIADKQLAVDVSVAEEETIEIAKTTAIIEKIAARKFSPSSFFSLVQCPLKFYFRYGAALKPPEEAATDVDAAMFGTILHKSMELYYREGCPVTDAVDRAVVSEYFGGDKAAAAEPTGALMLARDIVAKYLETNILPFDSRQETTVLELEKVLEASFDWVVLTGGTGAGIDSVIDEVGQEQDFDGERANRVGQGATDYMGIKWIEPVVFSGVADRIDKLPSGQLRIVDYKTGRPNLVFKGVEALFSGEPDDQNAAALQTFVYAMIYTKMMGRDVQPALYYVRSMRDPEYSPLLIDQTTGAVVESYFDYREEFEAHLAAKLSELFDATQPFTQCADPKSCTYCDYNIICRR